MPIIVRQLHGNSYAFYCTALLRMTLNFTPFEGLRQSKVLKDQRFDEQCWATLSTVTVLCTLTVLCSTVCFVLHSVLLESSQQLCGMSGTLASCTASACKKAAQQVMVAQHTARSGAECAVLHTTRQLHRSTQLVLVLLLQTTEPLHHVGTSDMQQNSCFGPANTPA